MQIKTTVRYHLTPVRTNIIKKPTNDIYWRGCGEKGILVHCWWEYKLLQPVRRTVRRFLRKPKIKLLYDPAIPLLIIYPEICHNSKNTCTSIFTAALFITVKTWKQLKRPLTEEWLEMWHIFFIHSMEYYSVIKRMK